MWSCLPALCLGFSENWNFQWLEYNINVKRCSDLEDLVNAICSMSARSFWKGWVRKAKK